MNPANSGKDLLEDADDPGASPWTAAEAWIEDGEVYVRASWDEDQQDGTLILGTTPRIEWDSLF